MSITHPRSRKEGVRLCRASIPNRYSPFFLNYGQHPWKGFELRGRVKSESAEEFTTHMKTIADDANSVLVKAATTMKCFYDRSHKDAPDYKPGSLI